jgi:hypothetical protein
MAVKVGEFFLTVGLLLLIIFFAIYAAGQPAYWMLFGGLASAGVGFFLWWKNRQPPAPSNYFQTVRKLGAKKGSSKGGPQGKPGDKGKK